MRLSGADWAGLEKALESSLPPSEFQVADASSLVKDVKVGNLTKSGFRVVDASEASLRALVDSWGLPVQLKQQVESTAIAVLQYTPDEQFTAFLFNASMTDASFALVSLAARKINQTAVDVGFGYAMVGGSLIQQIAHHDYRCCKQHVLGVCVDYHTCHDQHPRPDTPDELFEVKEYLAVVALAQARPFFPPSSEARQHEPSARGQVAGQGVTQPGSWDVLRRLLRAFCNSATVQQLIQRKSTSSTVTTVQIAVPRLASAMNVFKMPSVKVTDLGIVLDDMTAGLLTWSANLSREVAESVRETVTRADRNTSLPTQWEMQSFIHSNGEISEFVQFFSLYDRGLVGGSPVVDLVFCSVSDQMNLEKLTITTTSTMDETGHWNITHEVAHTSITGKDLRQFETQWEYAAADAILNTLESRPALYMSPRMRVFPLRLNWHRNHAMLQRAAVAEANGEDGFDDVFDGFMSIAKASSALWSMGKLFGSSKHTESIISQGNFNAFNEATNTFILPGVHQNDTMPMFNAILAEWDEQTRAVEAQHISAMSFSHSNDTDTVWTSQGVTWGNNRTDRHCRQQAGKAEGCAYYLTASFHPDAGSNHWAVCSYSTDFVVAPTLKLIEDSSSSWFGIFEHTHSEVEVLPPEFTPEDRNNLVNFTKSQCMWSLAASKGVELPMPKFPRPNAAIYV